MKKYIVILFLMLLIIGGKVEAESLELKYNLKPTIDNYSIIDGSAQKELDFFLYEDDVIYYNKLKIDTKEKFFSVDITTLKGTQTFEFTNDKQEKVSFTYYIFRDEGLKEHNIKELAGYTVFTEFIGDIQLIYTQEDIFNKQILAEKLIQLPKRFKCGTEKIIFIPYTHLENENIAGIAYLGEIKLYCLNRLPEKSRSRVLFHEITHLWANKLVEYKIIDSSYTAYETFAKRDKYFVSDYTKRFALEKGSYSEDFAESVANYIGNKKLFKQKYPNRSKYIEKLMYLTGVDV